jgi:long-chain acyl-CoA synthetase
MNSIDRILHLGRTRAAAPALIEDDRTLTYGELADRICRTASHMATQGLRRGERVGLCLGDTSVHVVVLLALARLGAVAVPLDWRARPAEIARLIAPLQLTRVLAEAAGPVPASVETTLVDEHWHRGVARANAPGPEPSDWNDPMVIAASSGSTGAPKFTLMTHLQFHFASVGMLELLGLHGPQRFLCSLPLYYSGGRNSCLVHLLRGDCVVLYPSLFTAAEYVEVALKREITVGTVVPSVVRELLDLAGAEPLLPDMTALFCTGAPLHPEEKRRAARRLTPGFHERYGTAETLALSVLRPADFADRADSVGQPHSLVEVDVTDEDGRPLPAGATGHLRIRGPGVAVPLPGGELPTAFRQGAYFPGEIARLDAAGYIFLEGRTSEVIIRGGAKIFPAEIEAVLLEHPGVLEAAVLGDRATDNHQTVLAFVVPRAPLAPGELLAFCRARLSPHKVPGRIKLLQRLPKNTAGKADKLALARLPAASP